MAKSKKPKGPQYRGLTMRGGVIYISAIINGKRYRRSTRTGDWGTAAAVKAIVFERKGWHRGVVTVAAEAPTFAQAAAEYRKHPERLDHLAATTRDDYLAMLREKGPLVTRLGPMRLDEIRRAHLLDWWDEFVVQGGRAQSTGRNHLNSLAEVFAWALDREMIEESPVEGLRQVLRRRNRGKRGRAESEGGAMINPIEKPADVAALVDAAEAAPGAIGRLTLLMLFAGLRLGEATALDWSDIDWEGSALNVRRSLSRGKHLGATKSGRSRRVGLCRRLRTALREAWMRAGRPEEGFVACVDHANLRNRAFPDLCTKAEIGDGYTPKSLRDTYASQLLTAGIQLGYISRQLGHADVAVTAHHYARWAAGDAYRAPMALEPGEEPADLLGRLGREPVDPTLTPQASST